MGMELDSKKVTLAGQALDRMLKLVVPVYRYTNPRTTLVSTPTTWRIES